MTKSSVLMLAFAVSSSPLAVRVSVVLASEHDYPVSCVETIQWKRVTHLDIFWKWQIAKSYSVAISIKSCRSLWSGQRVC